MEFGTVLSWKKAEGDSLSPQDVLAEVETDKATVSFECQDDCFVAKILVDPGSEIATSTPIMVTVMDHLFLSG